jgi:hypothetical protein
MYFTSQQTKTNSVALVPEHFNARKWICWQNCIWELQLIERCYAYVTQTHYINIVTCME